jgi:hypothetical protein
VAARRVVSCGAEVLEVAESAAAAFIASVRKRLKARRTMRGVIGGWREVVARGGPARAAELARAGTAMRLLLWAQRGATPSSAAIVASHMEACSMWTMMVKQGTRRGRTLAPATHWLLRRWLARWHEGVRYEWAADLEGCLARSTQADPAAGLRVEVSTAPYSEMAIVHRVVGARVSVPWEVGGFAGRRRFPSNGDVWLRVQPDQVEARAHAMWLVAGGWRAVGCEAKWRNRIRDAQMLANVAAFAQERPSEAAVLELVGWIGQVRAVPRSLPLLQRRALDNGMRAAGMVADGRRRWRVQEIRQERGRGARAEALIRWEGFDPRSGQPWPDSWERVSGLTADLRELLQLRAPPRQVPVPFRARPEVRADGLPARVSPRLVEAEGLRAEAEAEAACWRRVRLRIM